MAAYFLDQPLVTYLKGATHVEIRCDSPKHCGRTVVWLTSDLVRRLPRSRTVSEFQEKMVCQRCRCRGWATIKPAQRG